MLVSAGGCDSSEERGEQPAYVMRDSAGVTIVENRRPSWSAGDAWRIAPDPSHRIGRRQGRPEEEFAGVAAAVPLADGGIAVADEGSGQIRFFDDTGNFVRSVGSRGNGPGEFTMLADAGSAPDGTVWAYDFALRRISWIAPSDGRLASMTLGPEPPVLAATGALPGRSFVLRQLWGAARTAGATREGIRRDPVAVVRFDSAGRLRDTIAAPPGREVVIRVEDGRGVMTRRPFGADLVTAVRDGRIVIGRQDVPVLEEFTGDGTLRRRIALPERGDRRLQSAEIEAHVARGLVDVSAERRPSVRSELAGLPYPEEMPAYGRLVPGAGDYLWVSQWTPADLPARRWSIIDPRGVWLGDIELPPGFRLLAVADDRIVGVERDDLDAETVVVYPLVRD